MGKRKRARTGEEGNPFTREKSSETRRERRSLGRALREVIEKNYQVYRVGWLSFFTMGSKSDTERCVAGRLIIKGLARDYLEILLCEDFVREWIDIKKFSTSNGNVITRRLSWGLPFKLSVACEGQMHKRIKPKALLHLTGIQS